MKPNCSFGAFALLRISKLLLLTGLLISVVVRATSDPQVRSLPDRSHSLRKPYLDDHMHSRWWEFGGSTIIDMDRGIKLTIDHQHRTGWIFSNFPISSENFEINVEFRIWSLSSTPADGMAIWLTKERATAGPIFGSTDRFEGIGIFLDTYRNARRDVSFPYLSAMIGNGEKSYDVSDNKETEAGGCTMRSMRSEKLQNLRIVYWKDKGLELMYLAPNNEWKHCFNLPDFKLPENSYLGFSARTGQYTDNHEIISVETQSLHLHTVHDTQIPRRKSTQGVSKATSWAWFLFKVWLVICAFVAVYVGSLTYRARPKF